MSPPRQAVEPIRQTLWRFTTQGGVFPCQVGSREDVWRAIGDQPDIVRADGARGFVCGDTSAMGGKKLNVRAMQFAERKQMKLSARLYGDVLYYETAKGKQAALRPSRTYHSDQGFALDSPFGTVEYDPLVAEQYNDPE